MQQPAMFYLAHSEFSYCLKHPGVNTSRTDLAEIIAGRGLRSLAGEDGASLQERQCQVTVNARLQRNLDLEVQIQS